MPPDAYTKPALLQLAAEMLAGVLRHRDADGRSVVLPWRAVTPAPYGDEAWGGERELELETLARSLFLAACILSNEPRARVEGVALRDFYLQWLLRVAADPRFQARPGDPDQGLVEAALICISLEEGGLFGQVEAAGRARILGWLAQFLGGAVHNNNWLWFVLVIDAFLRRHGRGSDPEIAARMLAAIDRMYAGGGWHRDGEEGPFDFYNAWGFQFYPLFLLRWGALEAGAAALLARRNDLFLESFSHLFSRGGRMPRWGRSVIYRCAATACYSVAYFRPDTAFDPGFARHLCAGNLRQFLETPWLHLGIPGLGFYRIGSEVIDRYSSIASPMWCYKHFACLLLPDASPFWQAAENSGWWGTVERYDIAGTGMRVEHDERNSTLIAPQKWRGDARYELGRYRTDEEV